MTMLKKLRIFEGVLFIALLSLFSGCGNNEDIPMAKAPEIIGIATPVQLQIDSTVIELSDYFRHPKNIDSVFTDNLFTYRISPDSSEMTLLPHEKNFPRLSVMKVWIDGFAYSILLEKSRKIWQHISFDPKEKKYKTVAVAGDMNNWIPSKTPLHLNQKDGKWQTDILIFPGKYQYKLVTDGKWILDPNNPESVDNNIGGYNSLMKAGSVNPQGAPYLYTNKLDGNKISIGVKNKRRRSLLFGKMCDSTINSAKKTVTASPYRSLKKRNNSTVPLSVYGLLTRPVLPMRSWFPLQTGK